jgi:hypothetical protein
MEPTVPAAEFLYQAADLVSPDLALPGVLFGSTEALRLLRQFRIRCAHLKGEKR